MCIRDSSYDIFSRLLNDRIIMLSEDVNSTTASLVVAQLLYLDCLLYTSFWSAVPSRAWRVRRSA